MNKASQIADAKHEARVPMTMYDIQSQIYNALTEYEETSEELEEEEKPVFDAYMQEVINELANMEADKADNFAFAVIHADNEADFLKAEAKKLTEKAKYIENRIDAMKEHLKNTFQKFGIQEIKGQKYKIALRKSESTVVDVDAELLPKEFVRVIPESKQPDKKAIKEYMKIANTNSIEGLAHIEVNYSINIK